MVPLHKGELLAFKNNDIKTFPGKMDGTKKYNPGELSHSQKDDLVYICLYVAINWGVKNNQIIIHRNTEGWYRVDIGLAVTERSH